MLKTTAIFPSAAILSIFLGWGFASAFQQPSSSGPVRVVLRSTTICSTNILRLGDLASFTGGSSEQIRALENIPLAPSPAKGSQQTWNQRDIEKILALRGIDLQSLHWHGSAQCYVERSDKMANPVQVRIAPDSPRSNPSHGVAVPLPSVARSSNTLQNLNTPPNQSDLLNAAGLSRSGASNSTVQPAGFANAFVSPAVVSQAEHIVASLIESYLQTQTDSEAVFNVEPVVEPEQAKLLIQRRQIVGISGGHPPYDGEQEFQVVVRDGEEERVLDIKSIVSLPELYLAAKTQLPKGHVLRAEDLTYTVLPRGSKERGEAYVLRMDELVGKELKRSMSAKQMIRRIEVAVPKLIHVGDLIKIEVVLGGVVIETNGKALENGGADELIQVETIDYRKRLVARVRSERVVEVYSQGNGGAASASAKRSNHQQSIR